MILITVKYTIKPEYVDTFLDSVQEFTQATRAEPGNKWFEWYRSADEDNVFLLHEAFEDDGAEPHVTADHFKAGMDTIRPQLVKTPEIISRTIDGDGWDRMGELDLGD